MKRVDNWKKSQACKDYHKNKYLENKKNVPERL